MSQSQLTSFDQKLLASALLRVTPAQDKAYKVEFQFPPKIVSESNSANWNPENAMGAQPINIHEGSSGRAIEVEWEYIATDSYFTPEKISEMFRNLKSYFFEFKFGAMGEWMPVVVFKYTGVIPDNIPFRVTRVNITYGPEMIMQNNIYYPLYSKASASLEMTTQGGSPDKQHPSPQQFAKNLPKAPKVEWY